MPDIDTIMRGDEGGGTNDASTEQTWNYRSVVTENQYAFVTASHDGTGGYRDGTYLIPHEREMFYNKRRETSFYKNWLRPIIRAMVEPVFDERVLHTVVSALDPDAESVSEMLESFAKDCDGGGNSLQSFMQTTVRYARLHGTCFVVMDNLIADDIPVLQIDAIDRRAFPYVYRCLANQLYRGTQDGDQYRAGYKVDARGELEWIVFQTDDDLTDRRSKARWLLWDRSRVVQMKMSSNRLTEIKQTERIHGLGRVPVIVVRAVDPDDIRLLLIDSPVYDLARACHSLYNRDSEVRFQERAQGFSVFYMQTDAPSSAFTVGNKTILFVPTEASMPPGFASPNPAILSGLVDNAEKLREDIFRLAEQSGVTGVKSGASGVAIQWDFFAHESVLQKTAEIARTATAAIGALFGLYVNDGVSLKADYPTDFQPNEAEKELKLYDTYIHLGGVPPSGVALAIEKATRLVFSDEDTERVNAVVADIEQSLADAAAADEERRAAMADALQNKNQGGGDGGPGNEDAGDGGPAGGEKPPASNRAASGEGGASGGTE